MDVLAELTLIDNETSAALDTILRRIKQAERIDVGMAFLSWGGWKLLREALTAFVEGGGRLRVVLQWDRWRTSVSAVSALLDLPHTEVRFHVNPNFHAKRINFRWGDRLAVLTGSANLTVGGLETNPEDGVVLELDADGPEALEAQATFERWWRDSTPVTRGELERLKAERSESRRRSATTEPPERVSLDMAMAAAGEPRRPVAVSPERQRQADLRAARRLFELALDAQNAHERRRLVEIANGLLAQANREE